MRKFLVAAGWLALTGAAQAQSGFFMGGASEGVATSRDLGLQGRALELDAIDGGSRYYRLRQQQQLDAIERQLRLNNQYLEELQARRRIRGYYGY